MSKEVSSIVRPMPSDKAHDEARPGVCRRYGVPEYPVTHVYKGRSPAGGQSVGAKP